MPKSVATSPFDRYQKADAPAKPRIIGASYGEPGSGKTSFWLGAPGPLVIMSFDRGLEGVVERYQNDKDIYVAEYDWAPAPGATLEKSAAEDLRDKFIEDYEHALQIARTVVIDKETDMWGLFKFAEFGVSEKGAPQDWDTLKSRVRRLINMAKPLDLNLGVIQSMKNEWVQRVNPGNGKTGITQSGNRIRAGMDDIESLVHINIEHRRVKRPNEASIFEMEVGKSRGPGSPDVQDQTFTGLSFSQFGQLVFPETTKQDWI